MATVDYRNVKEGGPGPASGEKTNLQWWRLDDDQCVEGISASLKHMQGRQNDRLLQQVVAARLYGNLTLLGSHGLALNRQTNPLLRERISYNAIQSAIDTVTAKIAKNRPKPLFVTSGGDYKLQRKAKKLNQFVDGVFYENDAYKLGVAAFRDGAVWGDGVVHVFPENGRVKFERVMSSELWVDEVEAAHGNPRQMHRTKAIDRSVLLELARTWAGLAGRSKKEIALVEQKVQDATMTTPDGLANPDNLSDLIQVRESWRLPDGPEATKQDPKGGRHVISIDGAILFSEPYLKPFFPFARFRWSPKLYGYWSQGGAEQVQNLQIEINKLLWVIQRSFHLAGSFKVLLKMGSKVSTEHLNNDIGAIINWTGDVPPQYVVPQIVPPEIFQHLLTLKLAVYEQLGISMLSANSQKPAGLNSGKALREFNDIESDRFQVIGQEYERFFLDLARLAVSVVKDIAGGRSYKVKAAGRQALSFIDWKDINLDEQDYVLQAFPVSSLPNDPAGRMQTIAEWVQAGWVTPRRGRRLMDFPDLEMAEGLANAAEDYLTAIIERMVDEGDYTAPEPYDDLALARELALEYYQRGKANGLEEERLELLRRFLVQVDAVESGASAPASDAAPGAPQAVPMPPPVSELVPNVPGAQAAAQ